MGVDQQHPLYAEQLPDVTQMRDTARGQRPVKEAGFVYLPPTSGMQEDGARASANSEGATAYAAYRARAVFPPAVRDAVETMLGVMHHKEPVIELPKALEPLLERATLRNESLTALLRRINEEQLVTGRLGLLLEIPAGERRAALPHIALYHAENIINWDDGAEGPFGGDETRNLVVLDESSDERKDGFMWERKERYRVLALGDPTDPESASAYQAGVFVDDKNFAPEKMTEPKLRGQTLKQIPFRFINTKDVVSTPDEPPLLGLSNLALTIYRAEADYRQALYMQGQDTLVLINAPEDTKTRLGAGEAIEVGLNGDAKFIGVDSAGLPEMRAALENDYARADQKSNALVEAISSSAESGEALKVRVAARTASLNQIAMTGAFGLEEILKVAAVWAGANPEEVKVTPNTDFVADRLPGDEALALMNAKTQGAPLSLETIHKTFQDRGLTERTWEEERELIEQEASDGLPGALPLSAMGDGDEIERAA